jgi:hypothetical protein
MNWKFWRKTEGAEPGSGLNPFRETGTVGQGWWSPTRWMKRRERERSGRTPQQLEMILSAVKPVRNTLLDDDLEVVRRKTDSRLIYESKAAPESAGRVEKESDRAWERLRGRRLENLKVPTE